MSMELTAITDSSPGSKYNYEAAGASNLFAATSVYSDGTYDVFAFKGDYNWGYVGLAAILKTSPYTILYTGKLLNPNNKDW